MLADYYYDPFGRRLWKDVAGTRTYFFYSDEGLIAEYDASGNELKSYGYQPDSTWTTDPLFLTQNGSYYFYQNDHLGTPQKLVAQNGAVVWSAQYSAFGEADIQVETVANNLRFPGQYYDEETGLHYNFQRYYDPRIGRYVSVDPIGLEGGINFYRFVKNNPLRYTDPRGLTTKEDIGREFLDYSCRCGWIDWTHANAGAVSGLWDPVRGVQSNSGEIASKTGKGFLVRYFQDMYPGSWDWFTVGYGREYFVQYDLSPMEQESVALGIFKEVSEGFEGIVQLPISSSFSAEDLPSDLIAFYMAVRGYSKGYISNICGVVPNCVAEQVWDRTIGSGKMGDIKNREWTPKNFNMATCPSSCACPSPADAPLPNLSWLSEGCFCPAEMDWPKELDEVKASPKGRLWRDWNWNTDFNGLWRPTWPNAPLFMVGIRS